MAEAVTSRVSVLPTVGSKFQTGLSAAVGGEDRWCLSSGSVLDQVGHVAGQLDARMVPVEQFLLFSRVHPVMLAWLRPTFTLTSQFFLSDIGEDVEVPLSVINDQPVRRTKVYFGDEKIGPQMTEGTPGVGPTGDRWDGQCILDVWYRLYKWMDTQLWDPGTSLGMNNGPEMVKLGTVERLIHDPADKLLVEGNPNSGRPGDTTGLVGRNGQYEVDVYWLDGHPNQRGGSVITVVGATVMQYGGYIKGIPTEDWGLSNRPAVWNDVPEFSPVLVVCSNDTDITWIVLWVGQLCKLPTDRFVMSSGSFLKSVSTSTLDKLYDLPETIQDVMGLQAVRPSAAVCKVMTVPDSNCVRIVTPDEHVPTGFHEILIYDKNCSHFWKRLILSRYVAVIDAGRRRLLPVCPENLKGKRARQPTRRHPEQRLNEQWFPR